MKKFFIGLTIVGMICAAFYLAGRMPSPPQAPPAPVAERPLELPPGPTAENAPMVNTTRLKRFAEMKVKGPSPVETYSEAEMMMAAKKIKATDRMPANENK